MASAQLALFQSVGLAGEENTLPLRTLEFKKDDPISRLPARYSPIPASTNSYEIWIRLHLEGANPDTSDVTAIKFWFTSPSARWFALFTGVDLKYKLVSSFAQPSTVAMAGATSIKASPTTKVTWTTPHASNYLNESNMWTDYLVLQLQYGASDTWPIPVRLNWEYTVV